MRLFLIGADHEENLGLCMIAAAAEGAGHQVEVLAFNDISWLDRVVSEVLSEQPEVVGLSIQFQHRTHAFLGLARLLRHRGYRGHITCGGQLPTAAWREILSDGWGLSSVVLFEGERTIVELLAALSEGRALTEVPGLALPSTDGAAPLRTAARRLEDDLDIQPFARRYRSHTRHIGVPFIPIMGSRGCWGRCSYCSISTHYHDARARGGARLIRHRSPENIAEEMALLCHLAGGSAVFCFHDDNFLLPRPGDSLERVRAIREAVDAYGVGTIGFIGKCRPDSVTRELARELRQLGVVRMFVGVENVSQPGSDRLDRRVRVEQVHEALEAFREVGIFGCYNLLLFEPGATMADVEENVAFIRAHASQPINFCRVEPYTGTPLARDLAARGNLNGSYLGYDYRIDDDQVELLFRVCAAAFRERNFAPSGVHNRYMGLGYHVGLLDRFYDDPVGLAPLARESEALTRAIALETADFIDEAIALVREASGDRDRVEREAGLLALRISAADRRRHAELDELYAALHGFAENTPRIDTRPSSPTPRLVQLAKRVAQHVSVGMWLAASTLAAQGCNDRNSVPNDAGADVVKTDTGTDVWPVDPPPMDQGPDMYRDIWPVDPAPPPDSGPDYFGGDPPPPEPEPGPGALLLPEPDGDRVAVTGHFRDTAARARRSEDLPLFYPPVVSLKAAVEERGIRVTLLGGPDAIGHRWEGDGIIEGEGREVLWQPEADEDQIRVGVRSRGGVAVASLRKKDVG